MDKRYQVSVSSTYTDLKDERSEIFRTLMEMDLFPPVWSFFRKAVTVRTNPSCARMGVRPVCHLVFGVEDLCRGRDCRVGQVRSLTEQEGQTKRTPS